MKKPDLSDEQTKKEILKHTTLKKVFLLNDFQAIGHAITNISKKNIIKNADINVNKILFLFFIYLK